VGRNQTFNSLGNVVNAIALGLCGFYATRHGIFWFVAAISFVAVFCVYKIRHKDIDNREARGSDRDPGDLTPDGEAESKANADRDHVTPLRHLFIDRRLMIFAAAAILFHFANGGLGPLVSQIVSKEVGTRAMLYQSATTIAAQFAVAALGWWIGKRASVSLRKPIFIVAFIILPIRALLYVFTHNPNAIVAIAVLDGVGAGIFGILQLLVIADLTKGTGRFNVAQGALGTSVGIGASLSNVVGGYIVRAGGFEAGFATMAGVSIVALLFFWRFMPETKIGHETPGSLPKSPAYLA
jgi:sugar phosphate permease